MAHVIDYLCLKLGWTTDQVLDNAHFDNMRKNQFYLALDDVERTRPIAAIPLGFDKKTTANVNTRYRKALDDLRALVRGDSTFSEQVSEIEQMFGSKENIEDFFKQVTEDKIPMKKVIEY